MVEPKAALADIPIMLPPLLAFDWPARHYMDLLASFEILHGSEARARVMDLRLDSLEPLGGLLARVGVGL